MDTRDESEKVKASMKGSKASTEKNNRASFSRRRRGGVVRGSKDKTTQNPIHEAKIKGSELKEAVNEGEGRNVQWEKRLSCRQ